MDDFIEGEGLKVGTVSVIKAGAEVGRSNITFIDEDVQFPQEDVQQLLESTTEPVRKLASVRKIAAIDPIEGADRIVRATVDGWQLVTQKSNNFQPGDLVVYFEIDSFLPVREEFEFLRPACFKSTKHLGDGFRIKTIKLKGQVSQGLILPLDTFFEKYDDGYKLLNLRNKPFDDVVSVVDGEIVMDLTPHFETIEEGMDLTEYLGVKKYEKPLDPRLAGVARGNFPSFIRKTDQERVQNIFGSLKRNHDQQEPWEATLKIDGSSCTIYFNADYFGVCSRNLDLKETEDNTFWKVARQLDLETHLRRIGKNIALQGELMGPGVQGNHESFNDHKFFLFDIWDIDEQRYLGPTERVAFMAQNGLFHVEHAPLLGTVSLANFKTVDDVLAYADRKSIHHHVAEGVVFKSRDGTNSFKVINNKFLLAEKD